jgi:TldD protein
MLATSTANTLINYALDKGASFVDIFIENNLNHVISLKDSLIRDISSGNDFGVGIRVLFGTGDQTKVLYTYSNSTDKNDLLSVIELLCASDTINKRIDNSFISIDKNINQKIINSRDSLSINPNLKAKVNLLQFIDKTSRDYSDNIIQVNTSILQRQQNIEIFNSEGLHILDERNYTKLNINSTASLDVPNKPTIQESYGKSIGYTSGNTFLENNDFKEVILDIANRSCKKLEAAPCPSGKFPVVINSGFGGVIFHEACGHLLETTSVEKKSSVFHDKLNKQIANVCVNAVDDGTVDKEWGSTLYDDEGTHTKKTQLIKNGILTNFMVDKVGSMKTGYQPTGSARRQSYRFAPASRMRNTYIENGQHSLKEIISTVDDGIFANTMGGGSVSPGTGEFNFSVSEAFLIKNGEIKDQIKGATLIGSGADILQKISMVGNNLELSPGTCGSVSGSIPVTVGQPAIKVEQIVVGGQRGSNE